MKKRPRARHGAARLGARLPGGALPPQSRAGTYRGGHSTEAAERHHSARALLWPGVQLHEQGLRSRSRCARCQRPRMPVTAALPGSEGLDGVQVMQWKHHHETPGRCLHTEPFCETCLPRAGERCG